MWVGDNFGSGVSPNVSAYRNIVPDFEEHPRIRKQGKGRRKAMAYLLGSLWIPGLY